MELLFEFLFDLFIEGSFHVANNKKISPWIRIPLTIVISLFVLGILGLIAIIGIIFIKEGKADSIAIGSFFILLDIVLIISGICRFKKESNKRNRKD